MDIIITDHHDPDETHVATEAFEILNPKQQDCSYPEKNLSGAGIAFKIISALSEDFFSDTQERGRFLDRFLEMCALGSIADCVELTGENRILVKAGLEALRHTQWSGLEKLFCTCGITPEDIDEQTVGFVIAPRLNVASRIGDVATAVQLFLGKKEGQVSRLENLNTMNEERKELTQRAVDPSQNQIRENAFCQALFHEEWSPGILGLVASRQAELLHMPVMAATIREDGFLTASCRAPEGYSLSSALQTFPEMFEKGGGHDGAAGFLTHKEKYKDIWEKFNAYFEETKPELFQESFDAWIDPSFINFSFIDFLKKLSPFGKGNAEPIFGVRDMEILDVQTMGKEGNHLRIQASKEGEQFSFVAFFADMFLGKVQQGQRLDILFTISENSWNGERRLQLRVKDLRET